MPKGKTIEPDLELEDTPKETPKPTYVPRAVSITDMFNFMSDKLDILIQGQEDIRKLAEG